MKIGIITQPLLSNYGGLLQNYALQQALKRLGHEPITLDQGSTSTPQWRIIASCIKTFLLKLIGRGGNRQYLFQIDDKKKAYIRQHTNLFIDKYIARTEAFLYAEEFRSYTVNHQLDALIVGSDQVWRPIYNQNVLCSFLDFAKGLSLKRLAYAASFGVDYWEFNQQQTEQAKELICDFDAVSVRECSGINLCREYLHCDAVHVLDPTMLLDKEDYIRLVEVENEPKSEGNLFTYILDESDEKKHIIEKVASELGLCPFASMPKYRYDVFPSVTKWLRSFMDAEFVVCDSFHGAVFSIIFNKPFIVIGNNDRGMSRFISLLNTFNLRSRLINDDKNVEILINTMIDWDNVNNILQKLKPQSIEFLKYNLIINR